MGSFYSPSWFDGGMMHGWYPAETAPKDGTQVLGINNRGNFAVIFWNASAKYPGWAHPFTNLEPSSFWNGACGSVLTHWQPLLWPPELCATQFIHLATLILKGKTETCEFCDGEGYMPETALGQRPCPKCDGAGYVDGLTALRLSA